MQHKPFRTFDEQLNILEAERGLIINDHDYAKSCLTELNYYRLSGYSLTMRKNDKFYKDLSFEDMMQIYNFDKELKLYILNYLEDIEISLRTHVAYELGKQDTDPNSTVSYLKSENYASNAHFVNFTSLIADEISNSKKEAFVKHHKRKYKGVLPVWALVETLSFGKISMLYSSLGSELKKQICADYYSPDHYIPLDNLFEGLVVLRNLCAHHARLYNRGITVKPNFSKGEMDYLCEQGYERGQIGSKLFFRLLIIIRLSPDKNITETIISDINQLHSKYPFVDLKHYGFMKNWEEILRTLDSTYKKI